MKADGGESIDLHFNDLRPPLDNSLKGTSSWKNLLTKRDRQRPDGWKADEGH